jgi:hypothetical protein
MRPFPGVDLGITRFDSRSARPAFQDLADVGSRSVTGQCNRSGRDARVILRAASLGDVYEARWWPDWTGAGWRTVTAPLFSGHPDQRPPRGLLPAGRWPGAARAGRAERWPCWLGPHRSGRAAGGGRADQCRASAACLDHRRSARAVPWLENLVIGSCEALCASGRKAYYHRYCSGPRQLHSHGVAHVAVGPGFFNAFIDLRRK